MFFAVNVVVDGKAAELALWCTSGAQDYDVVRTANYPQTDVFVVCFSVVSRMSFENAKQKW